MARYEQIFCTSCQRTKQVVRGAGDWGATCNECESAAAEKAKKEHLDGLKALPLEERVARIEAWIYEHGNLPPLGPLVF